MTAVADRHLIVVACSATLPATTQVDRWLVGELDEMHARMLSSTMWVTTDKTMGDRTVAQWLREREAHVFVYGAETRREYRGGELRAERPVRLRNVDQEIVLDLDAARKKGVAPYVMNMVDKAKFAEDLEPLRMFCEWYRISGNPYEYVEWPTEQDMVAP